MGGKENIAHQLFSLTFLQLPMLIIFLSTPKARTQLLQLSPLTQGEVRLPHNFTKGRAHVQGFDAPQMLINIAKFVQSRSMQQIHMQLDVINSIHNYAWSNASEYEIEHVEDVIARAMCMG